MVTWLAGGALAEEHVGGGDLGEAWDGLGCNVVHAVQHVRRMHTVVIWKHKCSRLTPWTGLMKVKYSIKTFPNIVIWAQNLAQGIFKVQLDKKIWICRTKKTQKARLNVSRKDVMYFMSFE